jgi:hypothetical protein
MQQERDHWDSEYEKEIEACMKVCNLQELVSKLEDALVRRESVLFDLEHQDKVAVEVAHVPCYTPTPAVEYNAVRKVVFRNDELPSQLEMIQTEKASPELFQQA